jgi:hypothetical protein
MEVMTKQEMFNKAWTGLKAQGFVPCADSFGSCMYRDPESGRRCAFGHLISDEEYNEDLEGLSASQVINSISRDRWSFDLTTFADGLQGIHDHVVNENAEITSKETAKKLENRLREFAVNRNLEIPE